jgi:hypothetical protein
VTQWIYFPRSSRPTILATKVASAFNEALPQIGSDAQDLKSDEVLKHVAPRLRELGFRVEASKAAVDKIAVPVFFGREGRIEKSFHADAFHAGEGFVLEVEAGRAVSNNQFLKDLFQASMMHDARYLAIAVRTVYRGSPDFETVVRFFETLYASGRLRLPLEGVLVIGY